MDNQKRIMPGCEKLTKPEEISALKDYLRQGIQENEDSLVIGETESNFIKDPSVKKIDLETRDKVLLNGSKTKINVDQINKTELRVSGGNIVPGDSLIGLSLESSPKDHLKNPNAELIPGEKKSSEVIEKQIQLKTSKIRLQEEIVKLDVDNSTVIPSEGSVKLNNQKNPKITNNKELLRTTNKDGSDSRGSLFSFLSEIDAEEKTPNLEFRDNINSPDLSKPTKVIKEITENHIEPKEVVSFISENKKIPKESLTKILENKAIPHEELKEISRNNAKIEETLLFIAENKEEPKSITQTLVIEKEPQIKEYKDDLIKTPEPDLGNTLLEISRNNAKIEEKLFTISENSIDPFEKTVNLKRGVKTSQYKSSRILKKNLKEEKSIPPSEYDSSKDQHWPGDNNSDDIDLTEYSEDTKIPLLKYNQAEADYLNLNELEYSKYLEIKTLVEQLQKTPSGNWAKRVMSYLQASLSRTEKWRKTLNISDKEAIIKSLSGFEITLEDSLKIVNENNPSELDQDTLQIPRHHSSLESTKDHIKNAEGILDTVSAIGNSNINFSNAFDGAIRSIAEVAADGIKDGSLKQDVLDTVLYTLSLAQQRLRSEMNISSSRLPGNNTIESVVGTAILGGGSIFDRSKKVLDNILDHGTKSEPLNRPYIDPKTGKTIQNIWTNGKGNPRYFSEYLGTETGQVFHDGSDYSYLSKDNSFYTGKISSNFMHAGIRTTIEDLCPKENISIGSLEDLKDLLESSPYITTASKVNKNKVLTLDSNHVWELRLFPYLGKLNGNCSWLPNISEINSINYFDHGVLTSWGPWIPVTSFELQSRKITQKTLGLYDGEISFPVSMELSNELRLTLIDDQYKSWKRYFELCSECSTYLSKMVNFRGNMVNIINKDTGQINLSNGAEGLSSMTKDYTILSENDIMPYSQTTPIVHGSICPGMYKNLTFRCLIYIMTPQMSTVKKFDLLVVLRDYPVEYVGESDASSPDLNLSFSVVGENPDEAIPIYEAINNQNSTEITSEVEEKINVKNNSNRKNKLIKNILSGGINVLRR